jgi:hypothetical protein
MRLVYKKYADGTFKLYETDDEGRHPRIIKTTAPKDQKVWRVPLFIEVSCDDNEIKNAQQALKLLEEAMAERQQVG